MHLKDLDYANSDDEEEGGSKDKKANKFFQQEEAKRKERERMKEDKHLLGEDRFYKGGKKVNMITLPFATIDLVFNQKNIWGNMQNSDPTKIYYHLHNEQLWLPLITDLDLKHPL